MNVVILAAGRSSRFALGSQNRPKIFADFWGIEVLDLIIARVRPLNEPVAVVVNSTFEKSLPDVSIVRQTQNYGTGAAIQAYLQNTDKNLIKNGILALPADLPLLETATLENFSDAQDDVVIGIMQTPAGEERYGRIIFEHGRIVKIAEYKDYPTKTDYVNTGIIYLSKNALDLVSELKENAHGEIFLTDIVELATARGMRIGGVILNLDDVMGFNTNEEYYALLELAQKKWRAKLMASGAILQDQSTVYCSYDTIAEPGVIVEPYCKLGKGVQLRSGAIVRAFSYLENCEVSGSVGPFVHIKSGEIGENAEVGAFVQVKNSQIGKMTKIKHLAYIGDAQIGEKSNIGAGVVICNFDGKKKHAAKIGDRAMVGANSALVSPIKIGSDTFLAAGGVYTEDVADNEFAIARAGQKNKPNQK